MAKDTTESAVSVYRAFLLVPVGVYTGVGSYTANATTGKGRLRQLCWWSGDLSADPPSAGKLLRRTGASAQGDASPRNRKEVRKCIFRRSR